MILLALIFLQSASHAGVVKNQARVDKLVSDCNASEVVKFEAETDRQVIMHMMKPTSAPSKSDNEKFDCVLAGMKRMPELQFGFLGNVSSEPEAR